MAYVYRVYDKQGKSLGVRKTQAGAESLKKKHPGSYWRKVWE